MTSAERLLLRGQLQQESRWATTGTFYIDGHAQAWAGVVSDEQSVMTIALGGSVNDRAIVITANRQQFVDAGVSPEFGDSITYNGLRWVIEGMPGINSDQTAYEFRCVGQMNNRARR